MVDDLHQFGDQHFTRHIGVLAYIGYGPTDNNLAVYRKTGKLIEKYNVEEVGRLAGGGEYAVQDGFGWTNGVLLNFLNILGR